MFDALRRDRRRKQGRRRCALRSTDHKILHRKVAAVLAGGLVLGVGTSATFAAWTDQEHANAKFTSGIFALESRTNGGDFDDHTSNVATLSFEGGGMSPGSLHYAYLDVKTTGISTMDGTATLEPGVVSEDLGDMAKHLELRVAAMGASVVCNFDHLNDVGSLNEVGSATLDPIRMVPASLAAGKPLNKQGGNVVRYCFEVGLNAETPPTMQGKSARVTWTVTGESIPDDDGN